MNNIRKIIFIAIICVFTIQAVAEEVHVVNLNFSDGREPVCFAVSGKPVTYFETDNIKVVTGSEEISFPLDKFSHLSFGTVDMTLSALTDLTTGRGISFYQTESVVRVSGLSSGMSVILYGINGILYARAAASDNGTCSIPTYGLPSGVYVVSTESVNYKFTKK